MRTGKSNLRRHVHSKQLAIYDQTITKKKWPWALSTHKGKGDHVVTVGEAHRNALPWFSLQSFTKYLIRFIVADDQVIPLSQTSCILIPY